MISAIERAAFYLRAMPPGIQRQGGSRDTFQAATALVRGFSLDEETAFRLLVEIHNPTCQPQWSPKELRHKVKNAAQCSTKRPGYLLDAKDRERFEPSEPAEPERLDSMSYHRIASRLMELCPFVDDADVLGYLDKRRLVIVGADAQVGGVPTYRAQDALVATLRSEFTDDSLVLAGLLGRDKGGAVITERLWCAGHRVIIPWRAPDGSIDALQRRRLDAMEPRYVFPKGRRPQYPFGIEWLVRSGTLTFCEGAFDTLALRLISMRDGLSLIPLGLPGAKHWRPSWSRYAKDRDVLLAFDSDSTGDSATRISEDLFASGATSVRRWRPKAHDWCDQLVSEVQA